MPIESQCATLYLKALVMSALSVAILDIFVVITCLTLNLTMGQGQMYIYKSKTDVTLYLTTIVLLLDVLPF